MYWCILVIQFFEKLQNPDTSGNYDICFSNNIKVKQRQFYILFSRF